MARMKVIKVAISLILIVIVCFTISCTTNKNTSTTTTQVYTVGRGNISSTLTPTGTLQMPHQNKLSFGIAGTVNQTGVKMGDLVQAGQLIAKLDDATIATLQQAIVQAQINIQTAQQNLETAQTLTWNAQGYVTIPDPLNVSVKQLALDKANADLVTAQNNIKLTTLNAPYAGIIAEVNVNPGDKVTAATQVCRIVDPTQLQVTAMVNETDIFNVSIGLPAVVQVSALSSVSLPATVTAISPSATTQGGVVNYSVQLTVTPGAALPSTSTSTRGSGGLSQNMTGIGGFPGQGGTGAFPGQGGRTSNITSSFNGTGPRQGQPGTTPGFQGGSNNQSLRDSLTSRLTPNTQTATIPTLKEGLSVNVTITIQQDTNVILVPSRAVTRQAGNNVVQVLNSDNTTTPRAVTVGLSDYNNKEITSGLTDGEKIVITSTTASSTTSTNRSTTTQTQMGPGGGGGTTVFQVPGLTGGR